MRTRIYNARILTMEEKRPVFKGEIYIDGGKIFRIKEAKTEKSERTEKPALNEEEKWDEEIDAEGNLIMPGFKNAHTHSAMTFLRSYADDMKLQEWLFDKVFPAEAKLTSDDVYHLTKLAILEYLTSGITAAFDMYKLKQDSAKAAEELADIYDKGILFGLKIEVDSTFQCAPDTRLIDRKQEENDRIINTG